VVWKLSTTSFLSLDVKTYTDDQNEIYNKNQAVVIETNGTNRDISLFIYKDNIIESAPLKTNSADVFGSNILLMLVLFVMTLDHKVALLIGICVPLINISIVRGLQGDLRIRCNITVFYPR